MADVVLLAKVTVFYVESTFNVYVCKREEEGIDEEGGEIGGEREEEERWEGRDGESE